MKVKIKVRINLVKNLLKDNNLKLSKVITDNFKKDIDEPNDKLYVEGYGLYKNNKPEINGHRYYLYIDLKPSEGSPHQDNKILTVIMLNPSNTFPDEVWNNQEWKNKNWLDKNGKIRPVKNGFDSTIQNVIRIAKCSSTPDGHNDFSAVEILNLFSYIEGNSKIAKKHIKEHLRENNNNKDFIIDFIKKSQKPIMIAWSEKIATKIDKTYNIYEQLITRDFKYVFAFNDDGTPAHPSQMVDNGASKGKYKHRVRNFYRAKNPMLIPLKLNKD